MFAVTSQEPKGRSRRLPSAWVVVALVGLAGAPLAAQAGGPGAPGAARTTGSATGAAAPAQTAPSGTPAQPPGGTRAPASAAANERSPGMQQLQDLPLSTPRIVVLSLLGFGALIFLGMFGFSAYLGDSPRMESQWGGLGGGLGGWQLSPSLAFLIAGLLLSSFFVLASLLWMTPLNVSPPTAEKTAPAAPRPETATPPQAAPSAPP
jgi:hypothetical protein